MIPKHYFTMDEKCAEIGWAVREISNNLSRGGSLPWFPIQKFLMGGSTPKLAEMLPKYYFIITQNFSLLSITKPLKN